MVVKPLLEQLGPQQGVDEINHEPHGHEAGERIVEDHGTGPLQSIAGDGVAHRQGEKCEPEGQHDDVQHGVLLCAVMSGAKFASVGW